MNLTQHRAHLVSALTAATDDVKVFDHIPESVEPPALIVEPGSPFLDVNAEAPFGELTVHWTVIAIAPVATNEVATSSLDGLLSTTVAGLIADRWSVERVGQPYPLTAGTALHLASDIAITDTTTLETETTP